MISWVWEGDKGTKGWLSGGWLGGVLWCGGMGGGREGGNCGRERCRAGACDIHLSSEPVQGTKVGNDLCGLRNKGQAVASCC